MKFKVGDRVAVYESAKRFTGTVISIDNDVNYLYLVIDGDQDGMWYHKKQCRKLVRKKNKVNDLTVQLHNLERSWQDNQFAHLEIFERLKKLEKLFCELYADFASLKSENKKYIACPNCSGFGRNLSRDEECTYCKGKAIVWV